VYFWRWALWRLFEQQSCGGIVTFITASSYLAGPGFIGMREVMRQTFDELWIIDLGGDNLGTRKTPNVFNIQIPVAIAIGVRGDAPSKETPAKVHYTKIEADTREMKLARVNSIDGFGALQWQNCPKAWPAPFLPIGKGNFFDWPEVGQLFPLIMSGLQFVRPWPIAETEQLLVRRFETLCASHDDRRKVLFRESRDRKVSWRSNDKLLDRVCDLKEDSQVPFIGKYNFRSFDRHHAIIDPRFGDFVRPQLLEICTPRNVLFSTLMTEKLGYGGALVASPFPPDYHNFCGRGGRNIIPMFKDADCRLANLTRGIIEILESRFAKALSVEDIFAYVYAVLGGQSYTRQFWNELETPGPRIPVTKNKTHFEAGVTLGRRLIWLHTYAERFGGDGRGNQVPKGSATTVKGVPTDQAGYQNKFSYDETTKLISVGEGRFGPVAPEVWEFEVSGLKVVQSWLGYRMKDRKGRKSSPLDDIRPESWTAAMSDEFLELLWVLEATLDMEPELERLLDQVVAGPCFTADELPTPTEEERKPARPEAAPGTLL